MRLVALLSGNGLIFALGGLPAQNAFHGVFGELRRNVGDKGINVVAQVATAVHADATGAGTE